MKQLLASDVKGLDPVQEREDENNAVLFMPVIINGVKLTIGDLFPDNIYDARAFARKVALIDNAKNAPKKQEKPKEVDPESIFFEEDSRNQDVEDTMTDNSFEEAPSRSGLGKGIKYD